MHLRWLHLENSSMDVRVSVLSYLAFVHRANPDAEVSGPELERVLGCDGATLRQQVAELTRRGLVDWDPLLDNVWLRITDKGLAVVEADGPPSGPR
jgi:DNA-binding MarR family transcriptional regulator